MKKIILSAILLFTLSLGAQEYCGYSDQRTFNFGDRADDVVNSILEQADGKLLIGGYSYYSVSNHFEASILRLNTDFSPDSSFGVMGKVSHKWNARDNVLCMTLQDDGKILLGGVDAPGNGASTFKAYVARLNADGSVDTSFGRQGIVTLSTPGTGYTIGIRSLPDGSIRVLGLSRHNINGGQSGVLISQLTPDGSFDTAFQNTGSVFHPAPVLPPNYNGNGLFFDNGKMMVVSRTENGGNKPFLMKFMEDGSIDTVFSPSGMFTVEKVVKGTFSDVKGIIDRNGDIVIGATSGVLPRKYLLIKVDSSGEMAMDFGSNGIVESTVGEAWSNVYSVVQHPDSGYYYVLGSAGSGNTNPAVWQVNEDGSEGNGCMGNAFLSGQLNYIYSHRYSAALIDRNGIFRPVGYSGKNDTGSTFAFQNNNFMIPDFKVDTSVGDTSSGDTTTGLFNTGQDLLTLYPNPASDFLRIEGVNTASFTELLIYDRTGRLIIQSPFRKTLNIARLPAGMYMLQLKGKNERRVLKLLIAR